MKYKFLTKSQLIQERKELLKIVNSESEVDKLLKIRHFLTDLGIIFYISKIFMKIYKYKKNHNTKKVDIYMHRHYNNLDYHLFLSFSKNSLTPLTSEVLEKFENDIDIYKGAITKVYFSVSGFTAEANNRANQLGITLFGPNEILGLEKKISIEKFIKECKIKRAYNHYIYDVRFKKEDKLEIYSQSFQSSKTITEKLYNILENKRTGLIEKTQNDIRLLLKEVRNLIARENKIQSYMIFSNKTLDEIIRKRPSTNGELSDIKGIETYIIEKYGNFIIRAVI